MGIRPIRVAGDAPRPRRGVVGRDRRRRSAATAAGGPRVRHQHVDRRDAQGRHAQRFLRA